MSKIICLMGYTSSGKDTIATQLSNKLNIRKATSCTTRPMRKGEQQDREYHFLTDEEFDKRDFLETREYKVYDGSIWRYGYTKDEFNEDCIAIVDVGGYETLKEYFGDNVIPFFIYADKETLLKRLKERGDNKLEIKRRLEDDEIKFKEFIENKQYYKICNNYGVELAVNEIVSILNSIKNRK